MIVLRFVVVEGKGGGGAVHYFYITRKYSFLNSLLINSPTLPSSETCWLITPIFKLELKKTKLTLDQYFMLAQQWVRISNVFDEYLINCWQIQWINQGYQINREMQSVETTSKFIYCCRLYEALMKPPNFRLCDLSFPTSRNWFFEC